MTFRPRPYPEYRDSGVPWLAQMPCHWVVSPGFSSFREKQVKNTGMAETTVLSLSYGRIVVKPPEKLHGLVPASFETYQVVEPGEIIIRPTDLQNDFNSLRVGLARDRGIITSAYMCLSTAGDMTPDYGYLLLHAYDLKKIFYGLGSGLRQNLDFSDLKRLPVLIPSGNEQARIAAFVAQLDRRINHLIRLKRRMIDLLNEQRQAIIHHAVTLGLGSDVRLKPSGVPWLGDVPEHWTVLSLRHVTNSRCDGPFGSGLKSLHYTAEGVRVIRLQNIGHGEFRDAAPAFISTAHYATLGDHDVKPGDLLVAGLGDAGIPAGRACVAPPSCEPAMVKADCFRFRLKERLVDPHLLALQMSFTATHASAILSRGATRQRVNLQSMAGRAVVLPPIDEQKAILDAIERGTSELSAAVALAHREIGLLREYRIRLVADVVTGKFDVRDAEFGELDEGQGLDDFEIDEDAEAEETDEIEEDQHADE